MTLDVVKVIAAALSECLLLLVLGAMVLYPPADAKGEGMMLLASYVTARVAIMRGNGPGASGSGGSGELPGLPGKAAAAVAQVGVVGALLMFLLSPPRSA